MNTPFEYKDSAALSITRVHSPTSYFASSPSWGSPKQARGRPTFLGEILTAQRELKGMNLSYSQFNRQVRSGWNRVFRLGVPWSLYSSLPSSIASLWIRLRIRIYVQLSFSFYTGGDEDLCKSRDCLILVSASPIHNSNSRAFSCTAALELSIPPFSNLVFANFFSDLNRRAQTFCVKYAFNCFWDDPLSFWTQADEADVFTSRLGSRLSNKWLVKYPHTFQCYNQCL